MKSRRGGRERRAGSRAPGSGQESCPSHGGHPYTRPAAPPRPNIQPPVPRHWTAAKLKAELTALQVPIPHNYKQRQLYTLFINSTRASGLAHDPALVENQIHSLDAIASRVFPPAPASNTAANSPAPDLALDSSATSAEIQDQNSTSTSSDLQR
ncbi:phosphatidylinositol 3,4,5-trisphosphate 5-phosphatase 2-like [Leucoraja erinacea]|uniref:phosphatidylinositol 3,4,5-trisphosphate 5-phosphatase 2-like n=1 Tax=Leucoraja erinaceus TaxID=7782 RepID=UPI0024591129|nr:phosphatidylinositol 3,4,5-trisphosphate 5-phosphatase 2-like [Leucoraja erinacea]